jgi:transcriptional regulator with XRE-family HTH domain
MSRNIKHFVGSNIKKYRKQGKLTQQQLAVRLHCDRSVIAKLENGSQKTSFDLEKLAQCAIALSVGLHQLIPDRFVKDPEGNPDKFR